MDQDDLRRLDCALRLLLSCGCEVRRNGHAVQPQAERFVCTFSSGITLPVSSLNEASRIFIEANQETL